MSDQSDHGFATPSGAGVPEETLPLNTPPTHPGQSYPGPTYAQPTYAQPTWQQPTYAEAPPPAYGQPAYGQPAYGQPAYGLPGYGPYQGAFAPDHPSSNTALVLGILGLAGTFLCMFPVVLGPFAWFIGAKARREIDASPGQYAGRSQAVTGMVLGIITTVILVLGVVGFTLVVLLASVGSSTNY